MLGLKVGPGPNLQPRLSRILCGERAMGVKLRHSWLGRSLLAAALLLVGCGAPAPAPAAPPPAAAAGSPTTGAAAAAVDPAPPAAAAAPTPFKVGHGVIESVSE